MRIARRPRSTTSPADTSRRSSTAGSSRRRLTTNSRRSWSRRNRNQLRRRLRPAQRLKSVRVQRTDGYRYTVAVRFSVPRGRLMPADQRPNAVEMQGIVKRFPGVIANDGITFEVRQGEIHALLGENGAGKSTLMNILFGIHHPDEGEILVNGQPARFSGARAAVQAG